MKFLQFFLLCLMLSACGGNSDEEKAAREEEEKVFDPLIKSVDKAKAVEETVMQQKKDMDEAMKRMEEGDGKRDQDQDQ